MTNPIEPFPNIPLLRKAVEWAEAEAAKPTGSAWRQQWWQTTTDCGTAYCIAGYVVSVQPGFECGGEIKATVDGRRDYWPSHAESLLGLTATEADALFSGLNTITEVRTVAEQIAARAGERR